MLKQVHLENCFLGGHGLYREALAADDLKLLVLVLLIMVVAVPFGLHSLDRFLVQQFNAVHERHDTQIGVIHSLEHRLHPRIRLAADVDEHIGIAEPLIVNGILSHRTDIEKRVGELMDTVGIARRLAYAYPHELDGGRRQRVGIARALSVNPKFIVCDEPVSSLDVSIQAQVLNLMMDFQDEFGLTYMFITHDLSVVKHISDEIMVMYLGQCVERASSKELFANPMHPYTKALLSAVPIPSLAKRGKPRDILSGEVVSPIDPAPGCRFAARCKYATEKCKDSVQFQRVSEGHFLACKRFEE